MKHYKQESEGGDFPKLNAAVIMRGLGVLISVLGLVVCLQVLDVAWGLFDDQKLILRFAEQVAQETNINRYLEIDDGDTVSSGTFKSVSGRLTGESVDAPKEESAASAPSKPEKRYVRFAYLIAWFLVIMLLGLIARIGIWIMTTGGKLALYGIDQQRELKKLLRELLSERPVA